jgi:transcription initiation factor TFIID subunit 8
MNSDWCFHSVLFLPLSSFIISKSQSFTFYIEKMETNTDSPYDVLFERSLAIIIREYGFDNIELSAYHQILDISSTILRRLLLNVKNLMEIQSRTEPCPSDVARSLQIMNVKYSSLQQTFNQPIKHRLRSPDRQNETNPMKLFRVTPSTTNNSTRKHRPIYIPDFLPEFPDPHTFISSETYADLRKDYPRVRQLLADQRRALQRSLVKFKLQTNEKISVINNPGANLNEYYLIKNTISPLPYLSALLPQDQMDSEGTETMEDETTANISNRTKSLSATDDGDM